MQPNACIVVAIAYIERALKTDMFSPTKYNWQPTVLAAFIVAAKLTFEEPLFNEDVVKALRIELPVAQISRWESDFLRIISYRGTVDLELYTAWCFRLQRLHESLHSKRAFFFAFLMIRM